MNIAQFTKLGLVLTASVSLGIVFVLAGAYLIYPGYVDTGEPNIVALAWRLLEGYPVYLPVDDAARITNLYGPYLYLIHAGIFWLFGASVMIGKLPGILALVIGLAFVTFTHRRDGVIAICVALAYSAGIVCLNLPATIWDRPETFMIACVAVGVCLNNMGDGQTGKWLRVFGFGALIGVLMGLKAFAPIYFLPLGVLMLFRDGIVACIVTVVVALAVAAFPFAFDTFQFEYLTDLLGLMTTKPDSLEGLMKVLRYALYYLVPALVFVIAIARSSASPERRNGLLIFAGLFIAIVLVIYPAQKPGAGMYYLVPFAPIVVDLMVRGLRASNHSGSFMWPALLIAILVNVLAIPTDKRFWRSMDWDTANGVAAEIKSVANSYPDKSIEIGIGDNNDSYRKTYQRTRLVFEGHPYTLDTSIVIETTAWGIEIKPETIALISNCSTDLWLIPAGERPFDWIGYYGNDIYGPTFRTAFAEAYEKLEERSYFGIYGCRG